MFIKKIKRTEFKTTNMIFKCHRSAKKGRKKEKCGYVIIFEKIFGL